VRRIERPGEVSAALDLREEVFCGEQGVTREAERDGRDGAAVHLGAFDGDALVGTCRLLAEEDGIAVQRVAVRRDRRGRGIGAALMAAAERYARQRGAAALTLHAQLDSERFYRALGYESEGEPFLEEGIEHVAMRRRLA
jgi:predicted GNAT family N-acyltransferase